MGVNPRKPFPPDLAILVGFLGFLRERKNEVYYLCYIYINMTEYRSFAFTIRPLSGVAENGHIEAKVMSYISKHHGYLVAEMEDEARHLHGQIYFEKPKRKYDVNLILISYQSAELGRDLTPAEIRVLKGGTKIAYNNDFYTEYTNKPESKLLYDNMPINPDQYYPSLEEQQKVKDRSNAVDKVFHHLTEMFTEDPCNIQDIECARKWLYTQMYVKKTIKVIEDRRKFNQRAISLFHYIQGDPNNFFLH